MRFDEKARENLEAASRLLPTEDGLVDALTNASASRAYYSAYLAVADSAQRRRRGFTDRDGIYPEVSTAWRYRELAARMEEWTTSTRSDQRAYDPDDIASLTVEAA